MKQDQEDQETKNVPLFVMRFADDGGVIGIEIQEAESREWNTREGNIVSKTITTWFTPAFNGPVEKGRIIGVNTGDNGIEFFEVTAAPKINPQPNSIYCKRIPAPADAQKLHGEGELFFPSNSYNSFNLF